MTFHDWDAIICAIPLFFAALGFAKFCIDHWDRIGRWPR